MSLLVVTAFHKGDVDAAVRLYNWIKELGGINNDVLLVHDPQDDRFMCNRVLLAAKRASKNVIKLLTDGKHQRGWPHGPNAAFLAASKYAFENKRDFLWLEPDCVPIKPNWLPKLELEYSTSKKRYLGGIVTCKPPLPSKVMYGIGIYNSSVHEIASKSIVNNKDIAFDVSMSPDIVPLAHASNLIQIGKQVPITDIGDRIVLYHSDKNGSIISSLSKPQKVEAVAKVSVVITSHNRIERLKAAYKSCVDAHVQDIVITATGYDKSTQGTFLSLFPAATVVNNSSENSNDAWIAGCKSAKYDRITILHDDDKILPEFAKELPKHLNHPFCVWDARFHNDDNTRSDTCSGPYEGYGELRCPALFSSINVSGRLSITPVRGCFKKDDLIEWLEEAGSRLRTECYYRPHYLVGNDLWIYLRASTKYDRFFSLKTPLTSLGCNADSCTMDAIDNGVEKLVKIYDVTRAVYNNEVKIKSQSMPLHIITIVLDGAPFLIGQLQTFNRLKIPWRWSIVQGTSSATHCTSWCKGIGFRNSEDGTMDILDSFSKHKRIKVINKDAWDGKIEMVNAALSNSKNDEIVLQVDMDEFWESWQIEKINNLFSEFPDASHAMFWCRYFVGSGIVMTDKNCFANNPSYEWRRAWRRSRSQSFVSHEPPVMSGDQTNFIKHSETESRGLVFDHYSYVIPQQVRFKEIYYGYAGAMKSWSELQTASKPGNLSDHFSWAKNGGRLSQI